MTEANPENPAAQPAPENGVRVRIFGRTDVGMVREHNEDNFLIADLTAKLRSVRPEVRTHIVGPRGTLFAVCDGMGGAAAGEVASQMAVDTIYGLVQGGAPPENRDQFAQRLSAAINEAGSRIFLAAKSNRAQRGMGTTSTVAGVFGRTLFIGQVGDSRAYLLRSGKIKQLTKDQSLVEKLIEAGQMTRAEAESYEHSHIILQALGTSDTVSVDLSFMDLCQGDTVLLCSDGLSGLVKDDMICEVLAATDDAIECCKRLTDLANAAGGHDNITVIVARFDGDLPPVGPDDEFFGYQPYVITEPMEPAPAARPSRKIKDADAPPPGKDVKYATSIRPPVHDSPPVAFEPSSSIPDGHPPGLAAHWPLSGSLRTTLAVVLIALAVGILGTAIYLWVHRNRTIETASNEEAHTTMSATPATVRNAAPTTDMSTVATPIAAPAGWTSSPADGGEAVGSLDGAITEASVLYNNETAD
jgi:serine/threonine protein phosphatase PrpC